MLAYLLKENQPWILIGRTDAKAEAPILWPSDVKNPFIHWKRTHSFTGKDPNAGKDWRQEEKGMTEKEMVGWHHGLNGHEFEQTLGDSEGQGSLVCGSHGVTKNQTWLSKWITKILAFILANRLMEQNRKTRNRLTVIWSFDFQQNIKVIQLC